MGMEPMHSWKMDEFREALDEMRCPYCGSSNRENSISFECKAKIEIGENAGGECHNPRNWGDMPEVHVEQYQFDGPDHQIKCNACTLTTPLEDWFLADKLINEKLFFCISFNDKPEAPNTWQEGELFAGALHVRILESIRAKKHTPAGHEWLWVQMHPGPEWIKGMRQ